MANTIIINTKQRERSEHALTTQRQTQSVKQSNTIKSIGEKIMEKFELNKTEIDAIQADATKYGFDFEDLKSKYIKSKLAEIESKKSKEIDDSISALTKVIENEKAKFNKSTVLQALKVVLPLVKEQQETLESQASKIEKLEKTKTTSERRVIKADGIIPSGNEHLVDVLLREDFSPSTIVHIFKVQKQMDIQSGKKPLVSRMFESETEMMKPLRRDYAAKQRSLWQERYGKQVDEFINCKLESYIGTTIDTKA